MENQGVCCDVMECTHNINCEKCSLATIEISCQKTGNEGANFPHYCKSYCKK